MNFAYYVFLLLIIFFLILLLEKNLRYSPQKIKIYLTFVIVLSILRNMTLLILCVLKKANIILILKNFVFLNYITIPLLIIAATYILVRSEKIKFIWNYFIAFISGIIYFFIMSNSEIYNEVSVIYGFIVNLKNQIAMTIFSISFLGIIIILIGILIDNPFANRSGLICVLAGACAVFLEEVIIVSGIRILPYPVVGELILIIIMNLVINKFKNKKNAADN